MTIGKSRVDAATNGRPVNWAGFVEAIREDLANDPFADRTLTVREDISGLKVGTVPGRP